MTRTRKCKGIFTILLGLTIVVFPTLAFAKEVIYKRNFDDLTPRDCVPEFTGPCVIVENKSFKSPPNSAEFNSDTQSNLVLDHLLGIITVRIWMKTDHDPFNFVCRLEDSVAWGKNSSNQYFYTGRDGQVPIAPADEQWHRWKIVVNNVKGTFDLFFDGKQFASGVPTLSPSCTPVEIFDCNSGRAGEGHPSFIDNLKITFKRKRGC